MWELAMCKWHEEILFRVWLQMAMIQMLLPLLTVSCCYAAAVVTVLLL